MLDRRKEERRLASIQLSISDLFRQDNAVICDLDTPGIVNDISHSGLSFVSECVLPLDYFFNATITPEEPNSPPISATLKIVRVDIIDRTHYRYGCIFLDPPDCLGI